MVKIKDFTLDSKNLGGGTCPQFLCTSRLCGLVNIALISKQTSSAECLWSSNQRLRVRRSLHKIFSHRCSRWWRWVRGGVRVACRSLRALWRRAIASLCPNRRQGVDQRATGVYRDTPTGCARVPPAGRRAVDARALTGPDSGYAIATSVSLPHVAENQSYFSGTWMRWRRAMRGPLSTRNSSIYVELLPMSTRESLSAQLIHPFPSVCTRCASRHSLPLRLSATSHLAHFLSGPSSPEHTSSVSESLMWHTLHTIGDGSCGALYTSRRSPALSRTCIARTTLLP